MPVTHQEIQIGIFAFLNGAILFDSFCLFLIWRLNTPSLFFHNPLSAMRCLSRLTQQFMGPKDELKELHTTAKRRHQGMLAGVWM